MSTRQRKALVVTLVILLVAGAAGGILMPRIGQTAWQVIAADVLFVQASLILIWGLIRMVGNLHVFTSASYGFKRFHDLIRGRQMKSSQMKEDYLTYRENRPYHSEAKVLLIVGAVLMAIAFGVSLMIIH